jgi:two-component system CheB/CheR fusion protein
LNRELRLLQESQTDFLALMTHELRGPLGGIHAATDLMIRGEYGALNPRIQSMLVGIRHRSQRLLDLAETSLHVIQMDSGTLRSLPREVDLKEECLALLAEAQSIAEAKGVVVKTRFDALPPLLYIDREIVRVIFFNLLDNAIKYTDAGEIVFEVRYDGTVIEGVVQDTGVGIASSDIPRIFDRFYRPTSVQTHRYQGMGLGLSVVKYLVDMLGGSIFAASSGQGRGSTFTVRIPVNKRTSEKQND